MSGIIGHSMYAILAGKAATERSLPIAGLIHRHYASYLCGAYLGCDVQTMPEAICVDTGQEVGYGTAPLTASPLTGGKVEPWTLRSSEQSYRPQAIHRRFYGRAHLVFGWNGTESVNVVPWDHLADYCAAVVEDAYTLFGPGERQIAYLFGWMAHIVSDSLIKSIQPGITLDLLDGKYTPRNRPIQDLVVFHEIGVKELGLDWAALLADLSATPVEPVQFHYMRISEPRGELAHQFTNAWAPQHADLLEAVLHENRRYQAIRNARLIKKYALKERGRELVCDAELTRQTGGLTYHEMVAVADRADFRHVLWQMGEAIVTLFEAVVERTPRLQQAHDQATPTWAEISARWRRGR